MLWRVERFEVSFKGLPHGLLERFLQVLRLVYRFNDLLDPVEELACCIIPALIRVDRGAKRIRECQMG